MEWQITIMSCLFSCFVTRATVSLRTSGQPKPTRNLLTFQNKSNLSLDFVLVKINDEIFKRETKQKQAAALHSGLKWAFKSMLIIISDAAR